MLTTPNVAWFHSSARVEFGHSNVEMGAQPVFQAAHDLPFVFDRLRCFDA
jgi:hypothetical protein